MSAPETSTAEVERTDPYLIVSIDGHVGPSLEGQLRPYCPKEYVEQFDAYARSVRRVAGLAPASDSAGEMDFDLRGPEVKRLLTPPGEGRAASEARDRAWFCPGQQDPHARHKDMDSDGIAAEVVFAGGQNGEVLPFLLFGFEQGSASMDLELRSVGSHIYNMWLADFISVAPERHVGAIQVAIGDVDGAIREVKWGREHGLGAVNLPAPQSQSAAYTDPIYEPFWAACEELDLTLLTHTGGGDQAHGVNGPMGLPLLQMEMRFMSRRGLWQMIFGGVFERHPRLQLMFVENGVTWLEDTLRDMDSLYYSRSHSYIRDVLKSSPSEYWARNCYMGGSMLAPYEAAARDTVGVHNLCWGSDYPHSEATWPHTLLSLRNTFWPIPEPETRLILGENAVKVFGLDGHKLRSLADRIGPRPADLREPVSPDQYPEHRGFAFREWGAVA